METFNDLLNTFAGKDIGVSVTLSVSVPNGVVKKKKTIRFSVYEEHAMHLLTLAMHMVSDRRRPHLIELMEEGRNIHKDLAKIQVQKVLESINMENPVVQDYIEMELERRAKKRAIREEDDTNDNTTKETETETLGMGA